MSLVAAYGFSDDSEESETENENEGDITPAYQIESVENGVNVQGQSENVQNHHDADTDSGEKQQHQPSQIESFDTLLKGIQYISILN